MFTLEFNNLNNLNVSLQVGDAVYAHNTLTQAGADDLQTGYDNTGTNYFIGILRGIENPANGQYILSVDDDPTNFPFGDGIGGNPDPYSGVYYTPSENDFIMFSKYDQSDGDVLGYYADVKLVNDSKEKAELYVVSSEVIMNSK
tara:strand:- start:2077 stop:2508 length:432 start_codon:yes stop_codon:yes gene_type:complete